MQPFTTLKAPAAILPRANIDTDQIIPARFLRRPRGAGYHDYLFHDLPDIRATVLGAGVLVAGPNFGCGSSREGAVYALIDAGIRCVVAPSFGDIFAGNAGKNGLLLLALPADATPTLAQGDTIAIDLPTQTLTTPSTTIHFDIDPFRKRLLVEGLDDIALTLTHAADLTAWDTRDAAARPWANPPP